MRRTKELRTNKGITLIALVITIIVMLILVGVTITMAVNGGLFDYAGRATGETKNAINAEQDLGNGGIKVNGVWYDSIDDYLKGIVSGNQGEDITPTEITLLGPDTVEVRRTITLKVNSDKGEIPAEKVQWTSSKEALATVNNGVVTGVSADLYDPTGLGDWTLEPVTITAEYKGLIAKMQVCIVPLPCPDCNRLHYVFSWL